MEENMPSIDTSGIEALRDIKQEQDVIEDRIDKMETMRDKVSDVVFQKVRSDYLTTLSELKAQAAPLKANLRLEFRKVKEAMAAVEQALNKVNLEREEMEFRNELGEYEADFFEKDGRLHWSTP